MSQWDDLRERAQRANAALKWCPVSPDELLTLIDAAERAERLEKRLAVETGRLTEIASTILSKESDADRYRIGRADGILEVVEAVERAALKGGQ